MLASVATSLREASLGTGIYMGSAMKPSNENRISLKYREYIKKGGEQYESITAENSCKMPSIAKSWDHFDFTECDTIYYWTYGIEGKFRFHNLVWPNVNTFCVPSFIKESDDTARKEAFLMEYIDTVMKRYSASNTAYAVDVVNEYLDSNG